MASHLDYFLSVAKANSELALRLGEAARASFADLAQTGSDAAAALSDQAKDLQPGSVAAIPTEAFASVLSVIEKNREASLARFKDAIEEWQEAYKQAVTQLTDTTDAETAVQSWLAPFLKGSAPAGPEQPKTAAAPATEPAASA